MGELEKWGTYRWEIWEDGDGCRWEKWENGAITDGRIGLMWVGTDGRGGEMKEQTFTCADFRIGHIREVNRYNMRPKWTGS